jgi:valyl-tRNA synthetase
VVAALRQQGRIVAEKRPYVHAVGHCSRCGTVAEPRLSLQWFVKVAPLAKAAGDAVRDGRTTIHPEELAKRYFDWVDNMHDWCISRQLWWGHRIPVWYGPEDKVMCVGPDEEPPGDGWTQDPDVLDTWFSSALWPFSTLGWPDRTADLQRFYPNSVLVTGYDILFFWVARMMLFGLYAMDGVQPFDHVYLHGLIRDAFGKKMSKSRGNTIDPLDWLDDYGADATRFTMARGANPGGDMALSDEWAAGSRNFCNKLWNASRFAWLKNATAATPVPARDTLTDADRWILDRTDALVSEVDRLFDDYQFARLCDTLYHFTWGTFCDWYLEIAKVQLDEGDERAASTRAVLGHVLDILLRLLHPLTPFVTEVLWKSLTGKESLMVADWPVAGDTEPDGTAATRIDGVQRLVTEIRRFRSDQGLKANQRVPARLSGMDGVGLAAHEASVTALAKLQPPAEGFTPGASLEVGLPGGTVTVELDLSGTVDVEAERKRLAKDLAVAEKELAQTTAKLHNPQFTDKAPAEVVAKIKARNAAAATDVERIEARIKAISEV